MESKALKITGKFCITIAVIAFLSGGIVGGLAGALFVTSNMVRAEADAVILAVADSTFSLVPLLISLENDQLGHFADAAKSQINAGVTIMHRNVSLMHTDQRARVESVLAAIAKRREALGVGQFADPPQHDVEDILVEYLE